MSGIFSMSFTDAADMADEIIAASPELEREMLRGLYARPTTWSQLVLTLSSNAADAQEKGQGAPKVRLMKQWFEYVTADGLSLFVNVPRNASELWTAEIQHPQGNRIETASAFRGRFLAHGWTEDEYSAIHEMADDASLAEYECERAMQRLTLADWRAREGRERWERVAAARKAIAQFDQVLDERESLRSDVIPGVWEDTITSEYGEEIPVRVARALAMVRDCEEAPNMLDRPRVFKLLRELGFRDVRDWCMAYRDLYLSALNASIQV